MKTDPVALGFRFIAECSPDGFVLADNSGAILHANPAMEELLGIPLAELQGHRITEFFQTNLIEDWQAERIDFQDSQHCTRRVSGTRRRGPPFLAELRIQLAGLEDVSAVIFIVRDITEQESLRIRLKQQEALLKEIPEPIHILDPNGTIVYWNHGAEILFGYSASEAIGRFERDLLLARHPESTSHKSVAEYESTERWAGELIVMSKLGTEIRVERRKTVVREGQEAIGEVVFDLDLGERTKTRLLDRRRQRLESLGTLASGIAHDLNNLLTPIMMSCNMLKRPNANLDTDALLETISSGASRGKSLISQLLTFARGGDGQHHAVDIESVLSEVASIVGPTLPDDIHFKLEIGTNLPQVYGDETEIAQVLMNILVNARDAVGEKGEIQVLAETIDLEALKTYTVATLAPGKYLRVEVKDNGVGMSAAVRDHMFDPFYSTKERGQGTGLGLSTVLGIVQSHSGAVDVQSKVDCGTAIAILLPVYDEASEKSESHD